MFRIAYLLPDAARVAKEGKAFARLKAQVPDSSDVRWVCCDFPDGGSIAIYPGDSAGYNLAQFGEPRPTHDGLTFYPSLEQPDLIESLKGAVARPSDGAWVTTESGAELWTAVATMCERRYILLAGGGTKLAPGKHKYGVLARELAEAYRAKPVDRELTSTLEVQLVLAAIHASYMLTDEAIEDTDALHLSATDIDQIVFCALGHDPKDYAAALAASRSATPAAESPMSL